MKSYRVIIFFIVASCLLWNIVYYNVPVVDWVLLPLSIIFTFEYVKRFNFIRDLASSLVLLSLFLSVVFIATFKIAGNKYTYYDYSLLASFANRLYFEFILFSSLFLNLRRGKLQHIHHRYKSVPLSEKRIRLFFILTFVALTIGFITGSLKMDSMYDEGRIVLPFHLNGIIYVFVHVVAARLFMVIVENQYLTKGKIGKDDVVIMILLGLYGSFTSMSKGMMFYYAGLPLLILYFYYRPRLSVVMRYGAPVVLMLVLLFPIVGAMRSFKDSNMSVTEKIMSAQALSSENEKGDDARYNNAFEATFNRSFMSGSYYMNAYPHLNHTDIFDFSRVPFIVSVGSVAFIITHEVDGFPIGYPHNSGSTGIMDALFFGGYGFCYIVMFFIVVLASLIDNSKLQEMVSVKIVVTLLLFDFLNYTILEPFLSHLYWIKIVGVVFVIYVARRVNFRKVSAK